MIAIHRHISYLRYVLRHKWYVYHAGRQLGCDLCRCLMHDMSKFLPSEWFAYAKTFYAEDGSKTFKKSTQFTDAWHLHKKRNDHHWDHWITCGCPRCDMPFDVVLEMVADWVGAGMAISGKNDILTWYNANKDIMKLSSHTRVKVESLLQYASTIGTNGEWWAP